MDLQLFCYTLIEGQNNHHKWFASQRISSIEELETVPAGTYPIASHHQLHERERHGRRKHLMIFGERTREGDCQSGKHWNCFKGNIEKTSER